MSTAQTVLEYIQALKWPVVVSGVAVIFRQAIGQFLKKLAESDEGSMNVAGVADVKWKNQVNELARQTEIIEEQASTSVPDPTAERDIDPDSPEAIDIVMKYSGLRDDAWEAIDRSVITDPTGAVIGAWVKVEAAVIGVAIVQRLVRGGDYASASKYLNDLRINDDLKVIIGELRDLRNRAAHGYAAVDSAVALTYTQAAKRVVTTLHILFPTSGDWGIAA